MRPSPTASLVQAAPRPGLCGAIGTFRCKTGQKGLSSSIARHVKAVLMAAMLVTAVATAEEVKSLMGVV